MIAARLRPYYEARAKERYEATVGRPKKDEDKSVEKIPQIKSRDEAGKAAGVNASVQRMMRTRQHHVRRVDAGGRMMQRRNVSDDASDTVVPFEQPDDSGLRRIAHTHVTGKRYSVRLSARDRDFLGSIAADLHQRGLVEWDAPMGISDLLALVVAHAASRPVDWQRVQREVADDRTGRSSRKKRPKAG